MTVQTLDKRVASIAAIAILLAAGVFAYVTPGSILALDRAIGETAVNMVAMVTLGFENRSVDGFDRIIDMDDYLDDTMRENLDAIVRFIGENPGSTDDCSYYISIIEFLERVGDHACKMAEKVTFMVTGMRTVIN